MKKHIFYGILASSLLLGACSSNSTEEKTSSFDSEKTDETTLGWLSLTQEEKEKKVREGLEEAGYANFPLDGLIASLDGVYESGTSSEEDFETVFGYTLNDFQEPELIDFGEQYGYESYTDDNKSKLLHVAEKNDTVYVIHGDRSEMLYSYAKGGTWINKDIRIPINDTVKTVLQKEGINAEIYDFYKIKIFYDNEKFYFLLRDSRRNEVNRNHLLLHFSLTEDGIVSDGLTQGVPYDPNVVHTNKGKLAFITEINDMYEMYYLEDKTKYVFRSFFKKPTFEGIYGVSTNTVDRLYYFEEDTLMLIGDKRTYQMDATLGEPIWNDSGQEEVIDFEIRDSNVNFYTENTLAIAYGKDNTFNIYDKNLNPQGVGVEIPFDINADGFNPEFWVTSNEASYSIWNEYEYQGKPALRYAVIQKGIAAYGEAN